jgi:hypothetical protein
MEPIWNEFASFGMNSYQIGFCSNFTILPSTPGCIGTNAFQCPPVYSDLIDRYSCRRQPPR